MTTGLKTLRSTKKGEEDDDRAEDTKYDKGEKGDSRISHYKVLKMGKAGDYRVSPKYVIKYHKGEKGACSVERH